MRRGDKYVYIGKRDMCFTPGKTYVVTTNPVTGELHFLCDASQGPRDGHDIDWMLKVHPERWKKESVSPFEQSVRAYIDAELK